jgi:hypothetical protein
MCGHRRRLRDQVGHLRHCGLEHIDRHAHVAYLSDRHRHRFGRRRLRPVDRRNERGITEDIGHGGSAFQRVAQDRDTVDDREHRPDQSNVGRAFGVAHLTERAFGGMRECSDPRQIEKTAASLDGVDEAENLVEPRRIRRVRFPVDQRLADASQRLARFRHKFADQFIHAPFPEGFAPLMPHKGLRPR